MNEYTMTGTLPPGTSTEMAFPTAVAHYVRFLNKGIYGKINAFFDQPATPTANDLVAFANQLVVDHPSERKFVQEWFIAVIVSRFSGKLFDDVTLISHRSFSFDSTDLGARMALAK